jgi:PAS domain S-box-containing protein
LYYDDVQRRLDFSNLLNETTGTCSLSTDKKRDNIDMLRQQTTLARFGELALKSDDLDEILTEACHLVGEALGTDLAKVVELQEDGETLLVRAGVGWKPGVVGVATVKAADDTSEGHALKNGEPMISPDIEAETRFRYPPFLVENGVKAIANVLILGGRAGRPFGLLQIDSRKPRQFTDQDTMFLQTYANLIASAVSRLRTIEEMRSRELRLRESMDRQNAALETGLIGFFEWDVATDTIIGDRCFASFYGLDPATTATGVPLGEIFDLVHLEDREAVRANIETALASLKDYTKEFRLVLSGGEVRWVRVRGHCYEHRNGCPLRYTGTAVDVTAFKAAEEVLRQSNELLEARVAERTRELMAANSRLQAEAEERERVEEALRQSHKMEAVGQLTGGIAHDFNNLLAGISGSLELIRKRAAEGRLADLERYVDAGLTSVDRAAALTHRLLAFARRQTLDPKPTDLNQLVRGMEELFRRTVGPAIPIQTDLADELWSTLCDPNQMENALLNLVINARDAIPEHGHLLIRSANVTLPDHAAAPGDVPAGEYVTLSVTDTGTGMPDSVAVRAFDPFFTTKPLGQGTGLGLSMIYGFVQQSGGQVRLSSKEGRGTTVTLYLPRYAGGISHEDEVISAGGIPPARAGAAVLVVEDEALVRMVICDVLLSLGYTVLEADDAKSGLSVVESGAKIDLLLTDVGLPGGMNGRQLADAARQRRPELKVLFITGYAKGLAVGSGLLDHGMEVMTKPFAVTALATKVQGIIGN